jgi:hypothetical protein
MAQKISVRKSVKCLLILVLLHFGCSTSLAGEDVDQVKAGIRARLAEMQSLIVGFSEEQSHLSPAYLFASLKSKVTVDPNVSPPIMKVNKFDSSFSFLNGLARMEFTELDTTVDPSRRDPIHEVTIVGLDRFEAYDEFAKGVPGMGYIKSIKDCKFDSTFDIGLGMRDYLTYSWFDDKSFSSMAAVSKNENETEFTKVDANNKVHRWTFDRRFGYALTKFEVYLPKIDLVNIEIVNSDFREIEGVMLPFKMKLNTNYRNGAGKIETSYIDAFEVSKYNINSSKNDKGLYEMVWPAGSSVIYSRSGIDVHNNDISRTLDDQAIADADAQQKAAKQQQLQRTQDRIDRILGTTRPGTQPTTKVGN